MRAERFRVVSVLDEDLQLNMVERVEYGNTRDFDSIAHKICPGGRPTIFHVREVPHGLWEEYVDAPESSAEKFKRAFMCGVELVENVLQLDGVYLSKWAPSTRNQRSKSVIMDEQDLRLFSPAERQEIGSVIYMHSFLPRRIVATYLLQHSLQEPLTNQELRRVAASLSAAPQTPSGALLEQTSPDSTETDKGNGTVGVDFDSPMPASAAASVS